MFWPCLAVLSKSQMWGYKKQINKWTILNGNVRPFFSFLSTENIINELVRFKLALGAPSWWSVSLPQTVNFAAGNGPSCTHDQRSRRMRERFSPRFVQSPKDSAKMFLTDNLWFDTMQHVLATLIVRDLFLRLYVVCLCSGGMPSETQPCVEWREHSKGRHHLSIL